MVTYAVCEGGMSLQDCLQSAGCGGDCCIVLLDTMKTKSTRRLRKRTPNGFDDLAISDTKEKLPFSFVLDEITALGAISRPMFGFIYVYLEGKLLLMVRERKNQPERNGLWLATTAGRLLSLSQEFPMLPQACVIKTPKLGWVFLPANFELFEEYAVKACEMIVRGDNRIGV